MRIRPWPFFGGEPVINKPFRRHQVIGRKEIKAVKKVMKSGVLSQFLGNWSPDFSGGPRVIEFEKQCSECFGIKHYISVNSWTSGLIAAIGATFRKVWANLDQLK